MVASGRYITMRMEPVTSPCGWMTIIVMLGCSALLLTVADGALAQIPVHGRVVSAGGSPVDHAQVSLLADSTPHAFVLSKTTTDETGAFIVVAPSAGQFALLVRRIGYVPARRVLDLSTGSTGSVSIQLGDYWAWRRAVDSIAGVKHWERVAVARARARRWVCGDSRQATREAAETAYGRFAVSAYGGLRDILAEYAMPDDRDAFLREFTRPLSVHECATFAEGMDRRYGSETDTVRVFRFGKALYLPDEGEGGAFADWTGKVLTVFVVPS